ncbi:MAG: hypothetical protein IKP75_04490 [Oscillospiraceae bacterium]|nr:hypothetical protein [Oscillospiraceae bacterium]
MTVLRDDLILTAEKIFGITETIDSFDLGLLDDSNELMCDCTGCWDSCTGDCDGMDSGWSSDGNDNL